MRLSLLVLLVAAVAIPVAAVSLEEMGFRFDLGPGLNQTGDTFEWVTSLGAYGDLAVGEDGLLRFSIGTPFNRWLLQSSIEYTHRTEELFAADALLSTAYIPEDALGIEFDLGLRATLIDTEMWQVSFASFPVGTQLLHDDTGWEWNLLVSLNAVANASLTIADRLVLGGSFRGAFLSSRPFGEPLFPADETFALFTHFTMYIGYRLP